MVIFGSLELENYYVKVLPLWKYDEETGYKPNRRISGLCLIWTISAMENPQVFASRKFKYMDFNHLRRRNFSVQ